MKLCKLWLLSAALFGLGEIAALAQPPSSKTLAASPGPVTNSWVLRTNPTGLGHRGTGRSLGHQSFARAVAPPGVYVSEPYKCLVVVPGPHPDDQCLVSGGGSAVPMPMRKPELRLVPFGK